MSKILTWLVITIIGALITVAFALVAGALYAVVTWLVWNAVVPDVFGLKTITWTQAWLINILFGLLFKAGVEVQS